MNASQFVQVEVAAGGASFHNGNIWHGSGLNTSNTWRRSIGIHLIPSDASFKGVNVGYIYKFVMYCCPLKL
jgi:ectoine hydroxylase-related dioxygenase (phytanoyl-CoA dioxygenase family)